MNRFSNDKVIGILAVSILRKMSRAVFTEIRSGTLVKHVKTYSYVFTLGRQVLQSFASIVVVRHVSSISRSKRNAFAVLSGVRANAQALMQLL